MNRAAATRGGADPRWQDFWSFIADVGDKPSPKHTLRRHDPKKGYWKENCFWHAPVAPDLQQSKGRAAKAAYMRAYTREKPQILKKSQLKRDYGITFEEYENMLAAQDGGCAICGKPETNIHRRTGQPMMLAVDHAHDETKKVRGLLCHAHNTGIGLFNDDPSLLRAAISYLESHGAKS